MTTAAGTDASFGALRQIDAGLLSVGFAGRLPLPPAAELQWWYQYYFATERGRAGCHSYRRDFAKLIWTTASPRWNFDDPTFDRSAGGVGHDLLQEALRPLPRPSWRSMAADRRAP